MIAPAFTNFFHELCFDIVFFFSNFNFVESLIYYYYLSVNVRSFTPKEMIIISISVPFIRKSIDNQNIFNAIFYYQMINPEKRCLISQLLETITTFKLNIFRMMMDYAFNLVFYHKLFCFWITILILLFVVQICAINLNKNLRRKIIHFFMLPCISNMNYFTRFNLDIIILINVIISINFKKTGFFRHFADHKDRRNLPLSNVVILCSTYFPYYFLKRYEDFVAILITVFILDSIASIVGICFSKKHKSFYGMISGILSAIVLHHILFKNFEYSLYYVTMGVIEYLIDCNDNIVLPFFSVLFFRFRDPTCIASYNRNAVKIQANP